MSEPFPYPTLNLVVLSSDVRPFFITTVFLSDSHVTHHRQPSKCREGVTILVVNFTGVKSKALKSKRLLLGGCSNTTLPVGRLLESEL